MSGHEDSMATTKDNKAVEMPSMAFGTMEHVDGTNEASAMYEATLEALSIGYRHLDTAELYESTTYVGRAIQQSKVPREDLWLTSKLKGLPCGSYASVKARVQDLMSDLKTDYFDLLLIHWPGRVSADFSSTPEEFAQDNDMAFFRANIKTAWKNMQQLKAEGLARRVGVSNFYPEHLRILLGHIQTKKKDLPYANQIYIDLAHQEPEFVKQMLDLGMKVMAARPIAFAGMLNALRDMWDTTATTLEEVAERISKNAKSGVISHVSTILACLQATGVCVMPKSANVEHIHANWKSQQLVKHVDAAALTHFRSVDKADMLEMCGGRDEYAGVFRAISLESEAQRRKHEKGEDSAATTTEDQAAKPTI